MFPLTYQAVALRDLTDGTLYGAPVAKLVELPMFPAFHLGRVVLVHYRITDQPTEADRAKVKLRYIAMRATESPDGQFHCAQPTLALAKQLATLAPVPAAA